MISRLKILSSLLSLSAAMACLGTGPTSALANGNYSHVWVATDTLQYVEEGDLRDMISRDDLRQMLRNGAMYPDGGYAIGDGYGEISHWEPFHLTYLDWIRTNFEPPWSDEAARHIAFLMGMATHGMSDQLYDSMYLTRHSHYDENGSEAYALGGVDGATDSCFAGTQGPMMLPEPWVPAEVLAPLYDVLQGHQVDAATIENGHNLVRAAIMVANDAAEHPDVIDDLLALYPWACSHQDDPTTPGSPRTHGPAVARYWQVLWDRLHGHENFDHPPLDIFTTGMTSYAVPEDAGTPDSWVSFAMPRGLDPGTVTAGTVSVTRGDGLEHPVNLHVYYGFNSHLVNIKPQEDWMPETDYLVHVSPPLASWDGVPLAAPFSFGFSTVAAPAVADPAGADVGGDVGEEVVEENIEEIGDAEPVDEGPRSGTGTCSRGPGTSPGAAAPLTPLLLLGFAMHLFRSRPSGRRGPMVVGAILVTLLAAVGCSGGGSDSAGDPADGSTADISVETVEDDSGPVPVDWDAVFRHTDWEDDDKRRVVLLHTNDLHSHQNGTGPLTDFSPTVPGNDATVGGFARLATLVERERRDLRPGAFLLPVDAGDFSCGSAFATLSRTHGAELGLLDAMGFMGTTLGNHELDWGPEGTAAVIESGLVEAENISVLASNLEFAADNPADNAMETLLGDLILRHRVVEAGNGLRIGLFDLLGEGAYLLAPHAEPMTIRDPVETAAEMVELLRDGEGVDLVVCLSHGGVTEGDKVGEDEEIAAAVDGIDVIVSGHTHTLLDAPVVVNGTVIVQAGSYGRHLGRLVLVEGDGGFDVESWTAIPVDDAVPGLPEHVQRIAAMEVALDESIFATQPSDYRDAIAVTDFDLMPLEYAESNLADLITDAVRWTTASYDPEGSIDVAFEANGVIREGIHAGESGRILLGDAFRVLPLGIGPDQALGYPMLSFWLTGNELRLAMEVTVGVAPLLANSFFVQVSGLRIEYDPDGGFFDKVTAVYLGDAVDGYDETPLDTSPDNTTLYHVAANLYLGEMLGVLKEFTGGALAIELKDAEGTPYPAPVDALLDTNPDLPGAQELKLWQTLPEYLSSFPVDPDSGLPRIPERYRHPQDRLHATK